MNVNGNTVIKNSLFENNSAFNGGVIYIGSQGKVKLTIDNCVFNKNYAGNIGGVIYSKCGYGTKLTVYDHGVPMYDVINRHQNTIEITGNSKFNKNSAEYGGVIFMELTQSALDYDVDGIIVVEKGVVFENNIAEKNGGVFYLENAKTTITETTFKNNNASNGAGGVIHSTYLSNILIDSSTFTDNVASDYGGSIFATNNLNVTNSKFSSSHNIDFIDYYVNSEGDFPNGRLYIENNQMTGTNDYDIWFEGNLPMNFKTYLVFENKTIRPNEKVNLGELQDNKGNSILVSGINVILTKVGQSKIADEIMLYFNETNGGYTYNCNLDEGVYVVTGNVSSSIASDYEVIGGYLTISDYNIDVPDVTKDYGSHERLENTLRESSSPITNADVNININGADYTRTTDTNGKDYLDLNLNAGKYDATVTYQDVSTASKVIINQLPTTTSISYDKNSRNSFTLTALVNPTTAGGNVVFTVNGKDYSPDKINNGKATRTLSNLDVGDYEAKATYQGDVNHKSSASSSVKFTVNEVNIELKVPDVTKNYGGPEKLEITLTEDDSPIANENVNIKINDTYYGRTTDSNGKASVNIDLNAGSYDAKVTYQTTTTTAKITVKQLSTKTTLDYTTNSQYSVTLTALIDPATAGGNVVFTVNGKDYSAKVNGGNATYTLNNLTIGSYDAKATYSGDVNHMKSSSSSVKFTVAEYFIIVSAPDVTKYYGGDERFVVTVTDNAGKPIANEAVKVTINGQPYNRKTGADGRTTFAINLRSGSYEATTEHEGNIIKSTITVKTTVKSKDITKIFRNGTNYEASFLDKNGNKAPAGEKVSININGVFYQRTIKDDGSISFALNLEQGTYVLTLTNPYTDEEISNTVKILPNIIENKDLVKYYRNDSQFTFKLLDDKGNPATGQKATININGVFYTSTTNDKGIATFQINLEPGTYILTIEYKGCGVSNTVTVLSVIQTSNIKMKYQDGTRFKVTILDGVGKPYANQSVSFNINGVFYYRVTGTDGSASLAINLMAGKYIITTTYNSLNVSNKVTITG